jgi:hypothetical protein
MRNAQGSGVRSQKSGPGDSIYEATGQSDSIFASYKMLKAGDGLFQ